MRILGLVLVLVLLAGCKEKLIEPPADLIPQDRMTEMLYDLAVLNGIKSTNQSLLKNYEIETMPYLYEKYEVDSVQFVLSDQYYASMPQVYQSIYQEVQQRLEDQVKLIDAARKQRNDSIKRITTRRRDSINRDSVNPVKKPDP